MNVKYENKLSSNKNPLVIDKYTSILKTSCEAVETLKKSNKFPIQLNRETLLEGMIPIEINQFLNSLKNIKDNQNKYSYLTKKSNNKFNKNSDITESKSGLFDPANKPSNTQRRRAEVKKRSSKAFEKQANNTHNGSKFNLKPLNSELKTLSTGTDLKIESDRTFTHFNFDDTNNFSKTLGLNKELWKK